MFFHWLQFSSAHFHWYVQKSTLGDRNFQKINVFHTQGIFTGSLYKCCLLQYLTLNFNQNPWGIMGRCYQLYPLLNNYYALNQRKYFFLTCIPHALIPSVFDVDFSTLAISLSLFSPVASSPCCRVPIFKSRIQGLENW